MHVLDIALAAEPKTIRVAAQALCAWYWHVKKVPYKESDYATLKELTGLLWPRLQKFQGFGMSFAKPNLAKPKIHCAAKIDRTIRLFGSYEHVSTDAYERAHKAHKAVFSRYVHAMHLEAAHRLPVITGDLRAPP